MANETNTWVQPGNEDVVRRDDERVDPRPALDRGVRGQDVPSGGIGTPPVSAPKVDWSEERRKRHEGQGLAPDTGPEFAPGMFDEADD